MKDFKIEIAFLESLLSEVRRVSDEYFMLERIKDAFQKVNNFYIAIDEALRIMEEKNY